MMSLLAQDGGQGKMRGETKGKAAKVVRVVVMMTAVVMVVVLLTRHCRVEPGPNSVRIAQHRGVLPCVAIFYWRLLKACVTGCTQSLDRMFTLA